MDNPWVISYLCCHLSLYMSCHSEHRKCEDHNNIGTGMLYHRCLGALVHDNKIQNKNKSVYLPSGASFHMSSEHEGMVFCTPKLHNQGLFCIGKKRSIRD